MTASYTRKGSVSRKNAIILPIAAPETTLSLCRIFRQAKRNAVLKMSTAFRFAKIEKLGKK